MYYHGQSQELRATRTPYEHSKTGTRYHGEDDESLCYRTSNVRENTGAYESRRSFIFANVVFGRKKNQRFSRSFSIWGM
jgi:hypothetical protein